MTGHTPEPWDIQEGGDWTAIVAGEEGRRTIVARVLGRTYEEQRANALLLVAAPRIYQALREAVGDLEMMGADEKCLAEFYAVLEEVSGEGR